MLKCRVVKSVVIIRNSLVKTFGRLETEDDFNNLIIKQTDNQVVRFRDIGEAVLGPQNEESGARINGITGVVLGSYSPSRGQRHSDCR